MNPPTEIFHQSFCVALARYHASICVRATDPADKKFHGRRADAFAACVALPPSQMRLVLILNDRVPRFVSIREKMVGALHCPLVLKPTGF